MACDLAANGTPQVGCCEVLVPLVQSVTISVQRNLAVPLVGGTLADAVALWAQLKDIVDQAIVGPDGLSLPAAYGGLSVGFGGPGTGRTLIVVWNGVGVALWSLAFGGPISGSIGSLLILKGDGRLDVGGPAQIERPSSSMSASVTLVRNKVPPQDYCREDDALREYRNLQVIRTSTGGIFRYPATQNILVECPTIAAGDFTVFDGLPVGSSDWVTNAAGVSFDLGLCPTTPP